MRTMIKARFQIGQIVRHKLFNYRGVIFDVDAIYSSTDEWYKKMAKSRPPKNAPWYQLLVNNETYITYVAQQNLDIDLSDEPILHPMLDEIFDGIQNNLYVQRNYKN